ncbi:hypothetical protein [Caballeronia mineralivorans]|jgi:hypothetical protein|uniref:hypothetical protein n=1 Tax=Caballeronia mineralivorans TaxID=2010198 RepID=UPI0023F4517C|nr:hypothetical protein [Caballeronia mineralivorans]MDB5787481.1 hypothetical protein [Caballeronia mineralivorans]MEA3100324.1 hypothetical protein [Caballeronia mineralivorans]
MDELSVYTDAGRAPAAISAIPSGPLLELLLSDAATDVEVVTRELGLRDEMRERLRRALDRVACAQSVLEAIRAEEARTKTAGALMRDAMEMLAKEWPKDYPAGAVEWLLLES